MTLKNTVLVIFCFNAQMFIFYTRWSNKVSLFCVVLFCKCMYIGFISRIARSAKSGLQYGECWAGGENRVLILCNQLLLQLLTQIIVTVQHMYGHIEDVHEAVWCHLTNFFHIFHVVQLSHFLEKLSI